MQVGDLASIVAFILPGYVASEVAGFLVRSRKRDDFERLATSLFFSLLAYGITCGVVWLNHRKDWGLRHEVCLENWPFVAALFLVAVLLGGTWGLVTRTARLPDLLRSAGVYYNRHPDVWNSLWESEVE